MENCLFCKIIKGEIPSNKVYEDENILAFHDINPVAPVHVIVIPKIHIESANEITDENKSVISELFAIMPKIAEKLEIKEDGYRVITNIGENGGQTIKHLHFHIIGGTKLGEKLV